MKHKAIKRLKSKWISRKQQKAIIKEVMEMTKSEEDKFRKYEKLENIMEETV